MTMIEIQQAYIDRVVPAFLRVTERTKGHRAEKTRAAARREAIARLQLLGFTEANAALVVKDAQDIALLEISATEFCEAPVLSRTIKAAVRDEFNRQEPPRFTPLGWPF